MALVLGLGASGMAAARLLVGEGFHVVGLDARAAGLDVSELPGLAVAPGSDGVPDGDFAVTVVSPGIPATHAWIEEATRRGTPVISELELGFRHCPVPVMAITGSNGKSTVTKVCGEAMASAGLTVAVGGNFGVPFCDLVRERAQADWMVLEVSSFQLEWVETFRPRVAVLLNIFPNHLDRHGDMAAYSAAKMRLFSRMGEGDTAVVPPEWLGEARTTGGSACEWRVFGMTGTDYAYSPGRIRPVGGPSRVIKGSLFDNPVLGPHAAAVYAAVTAAGGGPDVAVEALRKASALPHRMREVATVAGVTYINDSKATNLASMSAAVRMLERPVRLIAGGLLKEKNLEKPKELLANKVRRVYLIGNASGRMLPAWQDTTDCVNCGSLERAVRQARDDAREGDVILLSPGCASFDQYSGFAERGEQFEDFVKAIEEGDWE